MMKSPRMELLESAKVPQYCDSMMVAQSQLGFQFLFGYRDFPDNPEVTKAFAKVSMSPQHFKAMFNAMKEQLEKFEQEYGEIILKKDVRMAER